VPEDGCITRERATVAGLFEEPAVLVAMDVR
jgi:hypothetical protein